MLASSPDVAESAELPPKKPEKITLELALKSSCSKADLGDYDKLSTEELYEKAQSLKTLHLEWKNIGAISKLEPFENVEILYLQHNMIERIDGLDFMVNLTFLALQHNRIKAVENLLDLRGLEVLDLSNNQISDLDVTELPQSIQVLRLTANPCTEVPDYGDRLRAHLPDLAHLDGKDLIDDIGGAIESLTINATDSSEVQLRAGEKGLSAYYRKDEMRDGMTANIHEQIEGYSIEALADVDDFSRRIGDAVKRSEGRRKQIDEQLAAVKKAMVKAEPPGPTEIKIVDQR
jgi:Leucine-rich repeat (LRR) protein